MNESQTTTPSTDAAQTDMDLSQSGEGGENTPDNGQQRQEGAQPSKKGSVSTAKRAEILRDALKREKDDPNVKFSDTELDILEEHYAGKLKPAKKSKPQSANADADESTTETTEEHPVSPDEEEKDKDAEDGKEEPEEAEDEEEGGEVSAEAEALMKEVGAKSLKDALAKVKQLRSKVGGKDAQAVAKLSQQIESEKALMQDIAKGVPAAIDHFERVYGVKIARPGGDKRDGRDGIRQDRKPGDGTRRRSYIPEDAFIDPDSAKMANDVLRQRDNELDELKGRIKEFDDERDRNRREAAHQTSVSAALDEMVTVAPGLPAMKGIANIRDVVTAWYNGKNDPRMEPFNELFDICAREKVSLKVAAKIKKAEDAERLIVEAETRGRKSAYGYTPNPSLSGQQGGKGEKTSYQTLTDQQIEAMSENHHLIPPDWFDDKDQPIQAKIPKRAWKIFGF